MTALQANLEAYGGNYRAAMEKFMDDEAFYLQMLQMLREDGCLARLDSALRGRDLPAAFDAAHELKGVAGNLCLDPLYEAVCAIVEPLRAGVERDYSPLYLGVERAFRGALALLPEKMD